MHSYQAMQEDTPEEHGTPTFPSQSFLGKMINMWVRLLGHVRYASPPPCCGLRKK